MSLHPCSIAPIPEETVRVAHASFPPGKRYRTMRDVLGGLYTDGHFTERYDPVGQHAEPPWRLALVTLRPLSEQRTDRQAADAVRGRMDGQSALGLALTEAGGDFSVRRECRTRLSTGAAEER